MYCSLRNTDVQVETVDDITEEVNTRKEEYHNAFVKSTTEFDTACGNMTHTMCIKCHSVSQRFDLKNAERSEYKCIDCRNHNAWSLHYPQMAPIWYVGNEPQWHLPHELSCLREGEKLLIQQISVYVPLHHLRFGQIGSRGHIVAFPQDISAVCDTLPRTPSDVALIRVIKTYRSKDGVIENMCFMIRKVVVLAALRWLKEYTQQYRNITITEENLDWIEDGVEQQLPPTVLTEVLDLDTLKHKGQEDRGPSVSQVVEVTDAEESFEGSFGAVNSFNQHVPKCKDSDIVEDLQTAASKGRSLLVEGNEKVMRFPYVSPDPVSEYVEHYLFEKAFPWLFPGGIGGFISSPKPKARCINGWKR